MRLLVTALVTLGSFGAAAQGLVETAPEVRLPANATRALTARQALARTIDIRAVDGRAARKSMSFGESAVRLANITVDQIASTGPAVKGICNIRLLVNDTPVRMARQRIEGTRGKRRPGPPDYPEIDAPVTTLTLPTAYPVVLVPVTSKDALGPKDRVTIELSSPSKENDCTARFSVSAVPAGR